MGAVTILPTAGSNVSEWHSQDYYTGPGAINWVNPSSTPFSGVEGEPSSAYEVEERDSGLDNYASVFSAGMEDLVQQLKDLYGDYEESTRSYNSAEAQKNRDFNAAQAALNRSWQEEMSNTAYQREIKDLIKAGLNPVLATKLGGASTPSGGVASGSAASTANSSGNFIGNILNSAIQLANKSTDLAIAQLQTDTQYTNALLSSRTSQAVADTQASASMYASDNAYRGTVFSSYNAGQTARDVETMREKAEVYIHDNYPSNMWNLLIPKVIDWINEKAPSSDSAGWSIPSVVKAAAEGLGISSGSSSVGLTHRLAADLEFGTFSDNRQYSAYSDYKNWVRLGLGHGLLKRFDNTDTKQFKIFLNNSSTYIGAQKLFASWYKDKYGISLPVG